MTARIEAGWGERGFVEAGGSLTAYQRAGRAGAPVAILLHGSPESADALAAIAKRLARRFDVIGLDTPGNGLSAPLTAPDPESADYARHLHAFMDVMGVGRAALYGFHTGAGTAMSFALAFPGRASALALDGYAVWTQEERADFLAHYLVTYAPAWDGSHLASIWARLEEQRLFFPWYDRRIATRMALPEPSLELRLRRLRDWLTAGDGYLAPYRAAIRRRGGIGPDRVAVPTLIGAMEKDPLAAHLERLDTVSDAVTIERWSERDAALDRLAGFLFEHPGEPAGGLPQPAEPPAFPARPEDLPWQPDGHGGFLLQIWQALRQHAVHAARDDADLAARLDPEHLHAQLVGHVAAHTGLARM